MSFPARFLVPSLLLLASLIFSIQSFGYSGGTLARRGGLTLDGNSRNALRAGALFSGTLSGASKWVIMDLEKGTYNYTLMGEIHGMMDGKSVDGATMVLTSGTGRGYFNGSSPASASDEVVHSASVPEPSTLALFGTGIFILTGALRRKAQAVR